MNGKQKTLDRLRDTYFNLLGKASELLYTCRAAIVRLISILRSAAQAVASIFKEELSTCTQTFTEAQQTVTSSATYSTALNLISSFGSLVMKTILIGFTLVTSMMAIIVAAFSKLFAMIKGRLSTK